MLAHEGGGEVGEVLGPGATAGGVVEGAQGLEEGHGLGHPRQHIRSLWQNKREGVKMVVNRMRLIGGVDMPC